MERWGKDNRKEVVMTDIDGIVPKNHLLRKIERVMDYEWIYDRAALQHVAGCHHHTIDCFKKQFVQSG